MKLVEVSRLRATPAIDGLVVVSHREHLSFAAGQEAEPGVLDGVGVLELVDQQVGEAGAVVGEQVVSRAEELVGAEQQLGEVDEPVSPAQVFVGAVDGHQALVLLAAALLEMARPQSLVLPGVDPGLDPAGYPALLVETEVAQHPADTARLVFAVENLKAGGQSGFLAVGAQQPVREPVKGAHPHAPQGASEDGLDARAHLSRRPVGEGDDVDVPGRRFAGGEQPRDTVHEHPGLAASRAGEHELMTGRCGDRVPLGPVQGVEYVCQVHSVDSLLGGCG